MSVLESSRKMTSREQTVYNLGFHEGKNAAIVHGRWIHASNKPGVFIGMKCSLCGARIKYSEFFNGNHNYCHKCGAKMDGDGDGNL